MSKVKIVATNHPRLNVGFVYHREEVVDGVRFTSLGGKHSVFLHASGQPFNVSHQLVEHQQTEVNPRPYHTEPHIRIGERIAADLWREEYLLEDAEFADKAAQAFLKRWEEGFFRGEVKA